MIVKYRTLAKITAGKLLTKLQSGDYDFMSALDDDYRDIHNILKNMYEEVVATSTSEYYVDSHMGLKLYVYLNKQPWFSLRAAADDGFWRYLSVKVVPDIVAERWDYYKAERFYSNPAHMWLKMIWWHTHFFWEGNEENTETLLANPNFNTDTALNLIDRVGRRGYNVELFRNIVREYSVIPNDVIKKDSQSRTGSDNLFRAIMRLNTARITVVEPALCEGGISEYVKSLIKKVIKVNDYGFISGN